jgi:diguanylate cyclase (GGDEF)-like protein
MLIRALNPPTSMSCRRWPLLPSPLRRLPRAGLAALLLALALPAGAGSFGADLQAAREIGKVDVKRAKQRFDELREQALKAGRLGDRLRVDEQDCRLLQDFDNSLALQVARAGAEALKASGDHGRDTELAGLRLAVCEASATIDQEDAVRGEQLLGRIIERSAGERAFEPAWAMALMERGNARSKQGDLISAQSDLLAACSRLRQLNLPDESEWCDVALASHFRRTGDFDEALRLVLPRLANAQAQGLMVDLGVYAHNAARIEVEQGKLERAARHYELALDAAVRTGDLLGQSYEHTGMAQVLKAQGRLEAALEHAQHAVDVVPRGADATQLAKAYLVSAELLNELHRPREALKMLDAAAEQPDHISNGSLQADWLSQRARALGQLGQWQEAYQALRDKEQLDAKLSQERLAAQSTRLRLQFSRDRDRASLEALQQSRDADTVKLRRQYVVAALGGALLVLLLGFALRKAWRGRLMQRLTTRDDLTGLPNRREVLDRLAEEFRRAQLGHAELSVLVVDIDRLKAINDSHGHAAGDEVLQEVARVLASTVRADDWVGRIGGEELVAVLPATPREVAQMIAERIRLSVEARPCATRDGAIPVTVSLGVAFLRSTDSAPDELLDRADALLGRAKALGHNRVCIEDDTRVSMLPAV